MATGAKDTLTSRVDGRGLAVGLFLVIVVLAVMVAVLAPELNIRRVDASPHPRAADAARYDAMTAYYTALAEAPQRAQAADAVRYDAMTAYYTAIQADAFQRARAAEAARYEAMTAYYTAIQAEETR